MQKQRKDVANNDFQYFKPFFQVTITKHFLEKQKKQLNTSLVFSAISFQSLVHPTRIAC